MPHPVYYRAGKDKKGKYESCAAVVKRDKYREDFIQKFKTDENFRNVKLRWTKHTVDEYVSEYIDRGGCPGPCIKSADVQMCSALYLMGELVSQDDKTKTVRTESGKEVTFDRDEVRCRAWLLACPCCSGERRPPARRKRGRGARSRSLRVSLSLSASSASAISSAVALCHWRRAAHQLHCPIGMQVCPYDDVHDGPVDDLPDDVVAIPAFGEASLLKFMRRRLVEKLSIYTYVGDIILCMNPYMGLPEMVDIAEYPNQKDYKLGEEPHAYASAYIAYWGQMDKNAQPYRNQSCIVSGESGAGKTVGPSAAATHCCRPPTQPLLPHIAWQQAFAAVRHGLPCPILLSVWTIPGPPLLSFIHPSALPSCRPSLRPCLRLCLPPSFCRRCRCRAATS